MLVIAPIEAPDVVAFNGGSKFDVVVKVKPVWGYKNDVLTKGAFTIFPTIDDVVNALFEILLTRRELNCVPPIIDHMFVEAAYSVIKSYGFAKVL